MPISKATSINEGNVTPDQDAFGVEISLRLFDNKWEKFFGSGSVRQVQGIMKTLGEIIRIIQRSGFESSEFTNAMRVKKVTTPTGTIKRISVGKNITDIIEARLSREKRVFFAKQADNLKKGYLLYYDPDHSALNS